MPKIFEGTLAIFSVVCVSDWIAVWVSTWSNSLLLSIFLWNKNYTEI